jgi:hypothetical protein
MCIYRMQSPRRRLNTHRHGQVAVLGVVEVDLGRAVGGPPCAAASWACAGAQSACQRVRSPRSCSPRSGWLSKNERKGGPGLLGDPVCWAPAEALALVEAMFQAAESEDWPFDVVGDCRVWRGGE